MRILGSFHVIHIIIGVFLIEPITEISVKEKVLNKVVRRTASSAEVSSYRFTNDKAMQVYTVSSTPKDQVDEMKSIAVIPEVCFRREDDNHSTCILKSCLKLFRSHQVWLMMLNGAFWGGSSGSFLVFTNEFIVNKLGLTEDEAALGVSIIGVTEIFGTGLVTFTSQFEFDRAILHSCTMIGLGISPLLAAVCFNKGMFYMLCIVWGLSDGACIANFLGYVYGFCQPDLLALLMGMNLLAQGAAIAMVSPIVGYLMQTVRAEYGILMSGLCAIAAAFVLLPVIVQRRKATRNYNMEENQRKH
ncbi:uncharacterized protein [Watersipora subatra]|uniref:uncharacterized protein isoform X1 n=1 Tax=Watersipora subatra TaxID=2589382 RepID=UPI00355C9622